MSFRYFVRTLSVLGLLALPALAHAQVAVTFGTSWDGPGTSLQDIIDGHYGPGVLNAATDYIGHDLGDPDPFAWEDQKFEALIVREISGYENSNVVGWYEETNAAPVIDGSADGVVFTGSEGAGATHMVFFPGLIKFGFYLNPNGAGDANNAPEPETFFTNRLFNDQGPDGSGAIHAPFGGDVQALVYDLSDYYHQPNVWLVAFEDLDTGANPQPCCTDTDNDYNDFVFEVRAIGTTEAVSTSLGRLKALYRR